MPFTTEPKASPATPTINGAQAQVTGGAMSARERAIAKYMGEQSQHVEQVTPVRNATQISPEELSATKPPSRQPQGQNNTNENIVEPEAPQAETKAEEPLSSQYAILARKEKQLRQREQQLKAREAALAQPPKAETPPPSQPTFDESKYIPKDRLTKDPFSVLTELGLTYDQLTEMAMNAPRPEQIALMNEMKSIKEEMEKIRGETKKSFEDSQKQQYDQAINQIRNDVKSLVKVDPAFETIQATGSVEDVVQLIERTFNEDGVLMSVEDAAREVEEYLVDEAIKLSRLKKIQQRLAPKAEPEAPKTTAQPQKQPLKTLTNSVGSNRQLSAKERAILAFNNKLNQS